MTTVGPANPATGIFENKRIMESGTVHANDNKENGTPVTKKKRVMMEDFRIFDENRCAERVVNHYRDMRKNQTVEFFRRMEQKYSFANGMYRRLMTIEEAFEQLENYVDVSDPDTSLPNKMHMMQTAEAIRRDRHPDWFQLVGLLHDMGKIMFLWGTAEDGQDGRAAHGLDSKQWGLGGDTFVVGCRIPDGEDSGVVFPQFNDLNPDMHDEYYNSKYGMYAPRCGLDELCFAWGHDEYMYRMLIANDCTIPSEGLDMIRYHSAYPLHIRKDGGAYKHFLQPEDEERIEWVRLFNKYDLYTKDDDDTDVREDFETKLWPYYKGLLEKYGLGGKLMW